MKRILTATTIVLVLLAGRAWAQGGTPKCYDAAGPANFPYQTCEAGVLLVTDDDNVTHDAAVGADGPQVMMSARTSQAAAVANGDAVRAVANIYGELVIAAYSWTSDAVKTLEQDPLSEHHDEETVADVTDGTDDTYYYYLDMDGYCDLGAQVWAQGSGAGDAVDITLECSIQDDGTAPASCDYIDCTSDLTGVASLDADDAVAAEDLWLTALLGHCAAGSNKYIRFKVVSTTGDDTGDWTIFAKRLY